MMIIDGKTMSMDASELDLDDGKSDGRDVAQWWLALSDEPILPLGTIPSAVSE